jgi:hypothetical protein
MKNALLTLISTFLTCALSAQINVTYKVDIAEYLQSGNLLGANGIRIGGNFAANGAVVGGNGMADWTPSDATSAMSQEDIGTIWSITVTYPSSDAGSTQLYKFVNNDWGTNEGTASNLIAIDGCGLDDGSGNINRTLTIPAADTTLLYCWDNCDPCAGFPTALQHVSNSIKPFVFPNPAKNSFNLSGSFISEQPCTIDFFNPLGQAVRSITLNPTKSELQSHELDVSSLTPGLYVLKLANGSIASTLPLLIKE